MNQVLRHKVDVEVALWDKDTRKLSVEISLREAIKGKDTVLLCVPSFATREVVKEISEDVQTGAIVIAFAKGMEDDGSTMDQVLKQELEGKAKWGVMGGPMLAEELATKRRGIGVIASPSPEVCATVSDLFMGTDLLLECSNDVYGVALASTLKNVYAILLGLADGLRWGTNRKGWLLAAATREMADILESLGCQRETAYGSAGLADLATTGFSHFSTNRDMGQRLALGDINVKSEGVHSLKPLVHLLNGNQYPFLDVLQDILAKVANPGERLEAACTQAHAKR